MGVGEPEPREALRSGTVLRDYCIEGILGQGGFSIVYRARHMELGNQVAIKEYLPLGLAVRQDRTVRPRSESVRAHFADGLHRLREEGRRLVALASHPGIVSCRDFFESNGTAYLVMEYEAGASLASVLRDREAAGEPFGEQDLLKVALPLVEGLARIHAADVLHRDIKPSNILIREDGQPVLIDFGAAKQDLANRTKSVAPFTDGYAAPEQVAEGRLGPWTDLYGGGAVLWRMVAGGNSPWLPPTPVKVETRMQAMLRGDADPLPLAQQLGAGRYSAPVLEAIDRCLILDEASRIRSAGELLRLLRPQPETVDASAEQAPHRPPTAQRRAAPEPSLPVVGPRKQSGFPWLATLVGGCAVAALLLAAELLLREASPAEREVGERFRDCWECPEMVVVPPGQFRMGSPATETGRDDDEGPIRQIQIAEPLAVGVFEVTFEEWDACVAHGGCAGYVPADAGWGREDRPVIHVSWNDAELYAAWLQDRTGRAYRLPSEAEWEYVARAGTETPYSFGLQATPGRTNYGRNNNEAVRAGSYRPNDFGIHDLHGNVWEWVQDCWTPDYEGLSREGRAREALNCTSRVMRGGAWTSKAKFLRSANRDANAVTSRDANGGFRVVRALGR